MRIARGLFLPLLFVILVSQSEFAQGNNAQSVEDAIREQNRPIKPFRVIANIYFVGTHDLSSFLIVTAQGHILLDVGYEQTAPLIRDNIRQLGFRAEDVRWIILSHSHPDHVAGCAFIRQLSGAKVAISELDAAVVASGGRSDPGFKDFHWAPCLVDRQISDGESVSLGQTVITAHLTPGHTKGCTTWTTRVTQNSRSYEVIFVPGLAPVGRERLVGNPEYADIAKDFEHTFSVLKALKCDVFLAQHPSLFGMHEKLRRRRKSRINPFIDPTGYAGVIAEAEKHFREQLKRESATQQQFVGGERRQRVSQLASFD